MPVNYDKLAARFDERYQYQLFAGIQARLRHLASELTSVCMCVQ